jgi:DNA-directed RNA polymerase specialized sigma24 family protein
VPEPIGEDIGDLVPGPDVVIPEQRNRSGAAARLAAYTAQLPERELLCLRLRFRDELSSGEIGRELSCTTVGARSLQHRALKRLAELVRADGFASVAEFIDESPDLAGRRRQPLIQLREVA